MKDLTDVPWGNVHGRREQLRVLGKRLLRAEQRCRRSFPGSGQANRAKPQVRLRDGLMPSQEFRLLAESSFMFAEASLNTLADALVEQHRRRPSRERSLSFGGLYKHVRENSGDSLSQSLANLLDRMQGLRIRVLLPRSVISVHPPPFLSGGGISFVGKDRFKLNAFRLWPDSDAEEKLDAQRLKTTLAKDVSIPPEVGLYGEFLTGWAISDAAEELSDDSHDELRRYMRKHGCAASPSDALTKTTDFLLEVATAHGHPPYVPDE